MRPPLSRRFDAVRGVRRTDHKRPWLQLLPHRSQPIQRQRRQSDKEPSEEDTIAYPDNLAAQLLARERVAHPLHPPSLHHSVRLSTHRQLCAGLFEPAVVDLRISEQVRSSDHGYGARVLAGAEAPRVREHEVDAVLALVLL